MARNRRWLVVIQALSCTCLVANGVLGFLTYGPAFRWFGLGMAIYGAVLAVAVVYIFKYRRSRPVSRLDQAGTAEVSELLASGKYGRAVRRVRQLTGLSLVDARKLVESLKR
jgi:hypothetical protein